MKFLIEENLVSTDYVIEKKQKGKKKNTYWHTAVNLINVETNNKIPDIT